MLYSSRKYNAWNQPTFGLNSAALEVLVWFGRICVGFPTLLLIAMLFVGTVGDLRGAFGDPILVSGEVVERTECADFNLSVTILRSVFGYSLVVNVKRAVRIDRDGSTTESPNRVGLKQDVDTIRRVHHRVAEKQEVVLICTSTGRAVATLLDLCDPGATKEIMDVLAPKTVS